MAAESAAAPAAAPVCVARRADAGAPFGSAGAAPWAPGPEWAGAEPVALAAHRAEGSGVRPRVEARVLWDDESLRVRFDLRDRFVRCVRTRYLDMVCRDSCAEFFVRPAGVAGYFNFEMNAGGTLHASYVVDPRRLPQGGFADWTPVPEEWGRRVEVRHSLPRTVDPEMPGPVDWCVCARIPLALLEALSGVPCRPAPGAEWRANLYHCADESSHPRWVQWTDVGPALDFHQPGRFGTLRFA